MSAVPKTRRTFLTRVCRWDSRAKLFRVARFVYARKGGPVRIGGYSAKASIALSPVLLRFVRDDLDSWAITILGVRFHYLRSYGGWIQ